MSADHTRASKDLAGLLLKDLSDRAGIPEWLGRFDFGDTDALKVRNDMARLIDSFLQGYLEGRGDK